MSGTSSRYRKNYPVSWEQLQRDCRALAWKLLDIRADWSRIVAVARGGLVPAAVIARELNIRLVDTVCISSYTMRDQSRLRRDIKAPGPRARRRNVARRGRPRRHRQNREDRPRNVRRGALRHRLRKARGPRARGQFSSPRSARTHGCSSRGTPRRPPTSSRPSPKYGAGCRRLSARL